MTEPVKEEAKQTEGLVEPTKVIPPLTQSEGKESDRLFPVIALVWQVAMIICFFFTNYEGAEHEKDTMALNYQMYTGVSFMMFVGFGYLMTFLKAYGLSAVGFTMFITCMGIQWLMIFEMLLTKKPERGFPIPLGMVELFNATTGIATVLISFGGLIGKVGPTQLAVLTFVEVTMYSLNKVFILEEWLEIHDIGGTIIIHVFGAYFGLAACATLGPALNEDHNKATYTSDIFSLVGTTFLWIFWPSFTAGLVPAGELGVGYVLVNTVMALLGSAVITFALLPLLKRDFRLSAVPIQNATLAGGVSIGCTADLKMGPGWALLLGVVAGIISCAGFVKPLIPTKYDTCGINNLHGMPGILGGLFSMLMPAIIKGSEVKPGMQIAGLALTLVGALITGACTGLLMRLLGSPQAAFNDESFWDCEVAEVTEHKALKSS